MPTYRLVNSLENLNPLNLTDGDFFILPTGELFRFSIENQLGGFFGVFQKIAGIAAPFANLIPGVGQIAALGLGALSQIQTGQAGQAKGLDAIQRQGEEVMAAMRGLLTKVPEISKGDAYTEADKLAALFDNPNVFYPAKKGKDAEALTKFRADSKALAAQIKSAADQVDAQRAAAAAAAQQQQQQQQNGGILGGSSGGDNTMIYLFGGAIILILLLK